MVLRISAVYVPSAHLEQYAEYLRKHVLPAYERAEGLISVSVARRALVAYGEFVTISIWQSKQAITRFLESGKIDATELAAYIVERSPPQAYEFVSYRVGRCLEYNDSHCPGYKEGAD